MKSNFQTIAVIVSIVFGVFAVLVFSGLIPIGGKNESQYTGTVTVWGTFPAAAINPIFESINNSVKTFKAVYVEKNEDTFEQSLIEALASGAGPDAIVFPENLIVRQGDKLMPLPFTSLSESEFRSRFVDEASILLTPIGALGVPLAIDPMVLYYDRDAYNAAGIPEPLSKWIDAASTVTKLTVIDKDNTLMKSGLPLGEYENISHAKEIISLLMFQLGNPIVKSSFLTDGGVLQRKLSAVPGIAKGSVNPAESALRFYTEFANPTKTTYSWNRTMPSSRDAFIGGTAAMYLGFSSEYKEIAEKNPHLNFDMAVVPQLAADSGIKATYGRLYSLGVTRTSKNMATSFYLLTILSAGDFISAISKSLDLPPPRRDILAVASPSDAKSEVLHQSALIAQGFLDPSPAATDKIWKDAVEAVLSGRLNPAGAASAVQSLFSAMLLR